MLPSPGSALVFDTTGFISNTVGASETQTLYDDVHLSVSRLRHMHFCVSLNIFGLFFLVINFLSVVSTSTICCLDRVISISQQFAMLSS